MKTRIILGPILLLVIAGLFYFDFWLLSGSITLEPALAQRPFGFIALAVFAAFVGALEVANMLSQRGLNADREALLAIGVVLLVGTGLLPYEIGYEHTSAAGFAAHLALLIGLATVALLILTSIRGLWRPDVNDFLPRFVATLATFLYVFVPVAMMLDLRLHVTVLDHHQGLWIIIWLIMSCRLGADSCAYFAGKSMGKHKMIPHVSPGKTWEGFVGGVVGAIGLSYLAGVMMPGLAAALTERVALQPYILLILGAVMGFVAPIGDLVASALKRGAGVKDSGNLLPEFGGIIDLIDGFLLTAPLIWLVTIFLG